MNKGVFLTYYFNHTSAWHQLATRTQQFKKQVIKTKSLRATFSFELLCFTSRIIMIYLYIYLILLAGVAACPDHCSDCDPSGQICFACAQSFELSVTGKCISQATIPKCILYGPTQQCFDCQPTYSLDKGNCLKNRSPCLETDPSNDQTCVDCGFGTFLKNGKCTGSINCAASESVCQKCNQGFSLTQNICKDTSGNCKTVGSDGVCVACNEGFDLNGFRCVDKKVSVYGCYIWDKDKKCAVCKAGYNTYQGYCLIPYQIQQIIMGAAKLDDILKGRPQTVTTTNTTTISTTTTITTTTTTTTTTAHSSSQSPQPTPQPTPQPKPSLSNPSSFAGFGSFGFEGGFGFGQSSSTNLNTNTKAIDHCSVYNEGNTSCLACQYGYYPDNNICSQVSPLCDAYNVITGRCTSCKFSLQLTNGTCIDLFCVNSQNYKCLQCKEHFFILNGICQFHDNNCKTPLRTRCQDCHSGYFVTIDGFCRLFPLYCENFNTQTYSCLQCKQGFMVSNGQCKVRPAMPANCQQEDPKNPGYCLTCLSGYTVSNGTCQKVQTPNIPNCASYHLLTGNCSSCLNGYSLINGACQATIDHCSVYSGNKTSCLACQYGYYPDNNICKPVSPLCDAYNVITGSCTSCKFNFRLSNGVCLDPFCASYTLSTGICTICFDTYEKVNGVCKLTSNNKKDPNCVKYQNNVCVGCSNRFYFASANNICLPVDPLCKDYLNTTGACTSCYPGYIVNGTTCIKVQDPFCKTFNEGGICTACFIGYFKDKVLGKCQPLNPLCKTSNIADGTCTSCYLGYLLTFGNCKVAYQDPNCFKLNQYSGQCTECSKNFVLGSDGTCRLNYPFCSSTDSKTGACVGCYYGYRLIGGLCYEDNSSAGQGNG